MTIHKNTETRSEDIRTEKWTRTTIGGHDIVDSAIEGVVASAYIGLGSIILGLNAPQALALSLVAGAATSYMVYEPPYNYTQECKLAGCTDLD